MNRFFGRFEGSEVRRFEGSQRSGSKVRGKRGKERPGDRSTGWAWNPWALFLAAVALAVATAGAAPPAPRFPGATTTLAANRADGRLAVLQAGTLSVYRGENAEAPSASFEIPGKDPAVIEFRGNQILYTTHGVNDMPVIFVAVSVDGRERLAWPNSGISELFPTDTSRLTLDGKGIYGFLVLDPPARAFFSHGVPGPHGMPARSWSLRMAGALAPEPISACVGWRLKSVAYSNLNSSGRMPIMCLR